MDKLLEIIDVLRKDMKPEHRVFVDQERARFPYGIWFRGEPEENPRLTPGVFNANPRLNEAFISNHLNTRILDLYTTYNAFDKLCLAQHYNIPTRLLDWTESLLVGIYFAVRAHKVRDKEKLNGKLYVLNAYRLNEIGGVGSGKGFIHTSTDYGTLFRSELAFSMNSSEWGRRLFSRYPEYDWERFLKDHEKDPNALKSEDECWEGKMLPLFVDPIAVLPVRTRPRMVVQGSTFTLHGGGNWQTSNGVSNESPRPIPKFYKDKRVFLECTIPAEYKPSIREQLYVLGVHEGSLFPEMEHQRDVLERMAQVDSGSS